jgi:hypothetical protein
VLIGGFAVNVYGVIRPSKDLDIVPSGDAENLDRLATLLARIGARHVGLEDFDPDEFPLDPTNADDLRQGANFRLETALGDLDIMQWVPGVDADQAYAELADLRKMKQAAGRPRDLDDLEKLSALNDG